MQIDCGASYLPVFGLTLQHTRVLGLVNVIWVLVFDLLDVGLSLDALILGESALMTLLQKSVSEGREGIASSDVLGGHKPESAGQQARCCGRSRS
jgi:hypothetical protein